MLGIPENPPFQNGDRVKFISGKDKNIYIVGAIRKVFPMSLKIGNHQGHDWQVLLIENESDKEGFPYPYHVLEKV